jgi:hypothetical protein
MQLSRDPVIVFVILFLLSLGASYVLFKLLDSSATIKRKGWSAGGAIAGFLMILFGSWYAIRPTLIPPPRIIPVSVPAGFKPISDLNMGVAIATPEDWERKEEAYSISVAPKQQEPNSKNPMFAQIQIRPCTELTHSLSKDELPKIQKALQQLMGFFQLRGPSVDDSYLGHKAAVTPASITVPGKLLEPPTAADFTMNLMVREVYDERNGRCITFLYPDSELGRLLGSTMNIANPAF